MKIKTIKTLTFFTTIFCALVSTWDFYLAWSKIARAEYGLAFVFFVLGIIMIFCFRQNLKLLKRIKDDQEAIK